MIADVQRERERVPNPFAYIDLDASNNHIPILLFLSHEGDRDLLFDNTYCTRAYIVNLRNNILLPFIVRETKGDCQLLDSKDQR